jgi:hypothetical protein
MPSRAGAYFPAYRPITLALAERNIRVKYKQAVLGLAWAVIQPLVFMAIFTLTIGRIEGFPSEGMPYAAFTLSALVPWTFLSTGVTFGANAFVADGPLIRKAYLPREVQVIGAIFAAIVDFLISLALFIMVGPIVGAEVSAWWLLAPVLAVPLALLAAGVSIVFGALNVYYRDFRYALPFPAPALVVRIACRLSAVGGSRAVAAPVLGREPCGRAHRFVNPDARPRHRPRPRDPSDLGRRHDRRLVPRLPGVQIARAELRGRDLT